MMIIAEENVTLDHNMQRLFPWVRNVKLGSSSAYLPPESVTPVY